MEKQTGAQPPRGCRSGWPAKRHPQRRWPPLKPPRRRDRPLCSVRSDTKHEPNHCKRDANFKKMLDSTEGCSDLLHCPSSRRWLSGSSLGLHKPISKTGFEALQPLRADFTYRTQQYLPLNYCETPDANNAGCFQTGSGKIRVAFLHDFVKPLNMVSRLGRDHTYQPVVVWTWEFTQKQGRAWFPLCEIGLRESE